MCAGDIGEGAAEETASPQQWPADDEAPLQQGPAGSEAPPACKAASSPTAKPMMMDAKQISEVCAFLHSDVDMTEAGPPS